VRKAQTFVFVTLADLAEALSLPRDCVHGRALLRVVLGVLAVLVACVHGAGVQAWPKDEAAKYLDFLRSSDAQAAYAQFGFVNATAEELKLKPIPR